MKSSIFLSAEDIGMENLQRMWARRDKIDTDEGMLAYSRYNMLMNAFAARYGFTLEQTVAAFVTLSPQNDYKGNIRSLLSCMEGVRDGVGHSRIVVSTYGHAKTRAIEHLTGRPFVVHGAKRGPKITAFYHNIIKPEALDHVTIDGHMAAIWRGKDQTMLEGRISPTIYRSIAKGVADKAKAEGLVPNQMQAILWFTRKRVARVKYDPQFDLFADPSDVWNTATVFQTLTPYPYKAGTLL